MLPAPPVTMQVFPSTNPEPCVAKTTPSPSKSGGSKTASFFRCPLARDYVRHRPPYDTESDRAPAVARKLRIQTPDGLVGVDAAAATLQRDKGGRHHKPPGAQGDRHPTRRSGGDQAGARANTVSASNTYPATL